MKVYISGPMTGQPDFNRPAFNAKAAELRALGHEVVNPAELPEIPGWEWADYLKRDIPLLLGCEAIYLLEGWEDSKGAELECGIAESLSFEVFGPPWGALL